MAKPSGATGSFVCSKTASAEACAGFPKRHGYDNVINPGPFTGFHDDLIGFYNFYEFMDIYWI